MSKDEQVIWRLDLIQIWFLITVSAHLQLDSMERTNDDHEL